MIIHSIRSAFGASVDMCPRGEAFQACASLFARSSPSLPQGVDGGATLGWTRNLYQGLFNSPNVVGESLKGTRLVSACLSKLGFETNPPLNRERTDIICAARLESRENLIAFCKAVQRNSPVGSYMVRS